MKTITLLQTPFTGLGKINRGDKWLKNRIQIFKQFVIPSLQNQTSKDFILHCCWRPEEKNNSDVKELQVYLEGIKEFKTVHTFHGILFFDDKYSDEEATQRLTNNLHYTSLELNDLLADSDYVLVTVQPSDDLYKNDSVWKIQKAFKGDDTLQAVGFSKGYIINYWNKETAYYNPTTNPPFYTIKFPTKVFLNPLDHIKYTSLKMNVGKYLAGTPLPSHEYVGDCLKYKQIDERGFCVGVHKQNISTAWSIPFKGDLVENKEEILTEFGIIDVPLLNIKVSARKKIYFSLPYKVQRKLRYWATEKFKLKKLFFWRNYTTKSHAKWWKARKIDWRKSYLNWDHPHRRAIRQILSQMQWMSLLEVGCGAGANLVQIAVRLKGRQFQLGGTDINADAIKVAENNGFFKGGAFFVCPADDLMMSDKSADIIISDMLLLYVASRKIDKHLKEMKRVARNWIVLCEFHSESFWQRLKIKLRTGYSVYNYKTLLQKNNFCDIVTYRLTNEDWPESKGTYQEGLRHIIIARVPNY